MPQDDTSSFAEFLRVGLVDAQLCLSATKRIDLSTLRTRFDNFCENKEKPSEELTEKKLLEFGIQQRIRQDGIVNGLNPYVYGFTEVAAPPSPARPKPPALTDPYPAFLQKHFKPLK